MLYCGIRIDKHPLQSQARIPSSAPACEPLNGALAQAGTWESPDRSCSSGAQQTEADGSRQQAVGSRTSRICRNRDLPPWEAPLSVPQKQPGCSLPPAWWGVRKAVQHRTATRRRGTTTGRHYLCTCSLRRSFRKSPGRFSSRSHHRASPPRELPPPSTWPRPRRVRQQRAPRQRRRLAKVVLL